MRDRELIPTSQIFDCRFHDFMKDDMAMLERIYAFANQPIDERLRQRFQAYGSKHERGRHGSIDYRLEDFGLAEAERRKALRHYQERFDVPDES